MESADHTRAEGSAEKINAYYDRAIQRACDTYGNRLTSRRPMSHAELTRKIWQFNRWRTEDLATLPPANARAAAMQIETVGTTLTTAEEIGVHPATSGDKLGGDASTVAVASTAPTAAAPAVTPKKRRTRRWWRKPADFVEPAKPKRRNGRPTNAELAARAAAQAVPSAKPPAAASGSPAPARANAPAASEPSSPVRLTGARPPSGKPAPAASSTPTVRAPVTMALPRFNRELHVLAGRQKGDELVRAFQASATSIAKISLDPLPPASAKRADWVLAATTLHNTRVQRLNTLEGETTGAVDVWRSESKRDLDELRSGLLRAGANHVTDHLAQVDGWLRFVHAQAEAIQARVDRLHARWLESIRAALDGDLAAINKRFPPGSEPEKKRGGPARKYDQKTGDAAEEADDADVA